MQENKRENLKFYFLVWFSFFFFTLISGFLVQFLILPKLFPEIHWGEGLINYSDSPGFHREALLLEKKIQSEGWQVWLKSFQPNLRIISWIVAFFYSLFGIPKPWIILPFNAFLHASSGLIIIFLLLKFKIDKKIALISSLPFAIFPSSLTWTSQIHKDGLYIFGFYLFFLALFELCEDKIKNIFLSCLFFIFSFLTIYLARYYSLIVLKYLLYLISLIFSIRVIYFLLKKDLYKGKLETLKVAILIFLIFFSSFLTSQSEKSISQPQIKPSINWQKTSLVPSKYNNVLQRIVEYRHAFFIYYNDASTNIEKEVIFQKAPDFLFYLPRGLFLGLFSPFPDLWFKKGDNLASTFKRFIVPFEMSVVWFGLILLPFSIFKYRKDLKFYLVLAICNLFIYLHVILEPNIGTIYRKRYGFLLLLIAISLATFFENLKKKKLKNYLF